MTAQSGAGIEPHTENSNSVKRGTEWSPRFKARIASVFEFLEGFTSAVGQVTILNSLIVSGDAPATANNMLANEPLYRLGFAFTVISVAFHLIWVFLFYELFKPVNRRVSFFALLVMLMGCAIQAIASTLYLAPLLMLKGGSALSAFSTEQLQAQAYIFLKLNGLAFDIYLVFFGFWCVLIGYLIFRSTFLPRILGVLLMIDGMGWAIYLSPPLATSLFPLIATASGLAELPLQLWLLVRGVDPERWNEEANAASAKD